MSKKISLKGTGVALVTPFHKDGTIDFKSLKKLVDHVIINGVDYLVVLGTTGESVTLNKDEKNAIVDYVVECNNGRVPLVMGIGGCNTQEIVNCIRDSDLENINAILSVSPYYNKPSQKGIYLHYKTISSVSPLPIIIYNVPGRTASNITSETTLKLAQDFENIIAVKEASGNLFQCMEILKNKPKDFLLISGDDMLTFPLLALGADGVISVAANAFAKDFSDMVQHALKGNWSKSRELHFKLLEVMDLLIVEGNPAGIKASLEILKICSDNLRLPLTSVSKPTYNKLAGIIAEFL
jgi:4-hydroxy-tetrahydrodipicolinate synthase